MFTVSELYIHIPWIDSNSFLATKKVIPGN